VIIAAALCPAAPLLVRELNGGDPVLPELRQACLDAVAELAAGEPDVIAVVGVACQTGSWDASSALDLARFAPRPGSGPAAEPPVPSSLGVGAWLLTAAGYAGGRVLQSVAKDEPPAACAEVGAALARAGLRVGLLVMADGSARRTLKAPGYLDERSAAFDAEVERAVRAGHLGALLRIDPDLARDLMAAGRPAWQALAGALEGGQVTSEIRYSDDPFGVAYLVASLRIQPA
jgi:hypothetical protein